MSATEPLPIDEPAQETHSRDTGTGCGATMQSPSGLLVCDRELFHPGAHSEGGADRMAKKVIEETRHFDYSGPCCELYSRVGLEIRERLPISDEQATNAEVLARMDAVHEALIEYELPTDTIAHPKRLYGMTGPRYRWYSVIFDDGSTGGIWADSAGEAIIETALWSGKAVVRVIADPDWAKHRAIGKGAAAMEVALW